MQTTIELTPSSQAASVVAVLLVASLAMPAAVFAQTDRSSVGKMPADQLKAVYMHCDRQATTSLLSLGSAAGCSIVHEELKDRVFGGDFNRLIAWWRLHKTDESLAGANDAAATAARTRTAAP